MAFSRDASLLTHCRAKPHAPVQAMWSDAGDGTRDIVHLSNLAHGDWKIDSGSNYSALPLCGVLPHATLAVLAVPLCYLYDSDFQLFHVYRAMVSWSFCLWETT